MNMALFEWDDSFITNVQKIDEQHRVLVNTINELHTAMTQGKSNEMLTEIIQGLVDYTVTHFQTEENFMQQHQYPDFPSHKKEHDEFVSEVGKFQQDFLAKKVFLSIKVFNFLIEWIDNHIRTSDQKLGKFLVEKI